MSRTASPPIPARPSTAWPTSAWTVARSALTMGLQNTVIQDLMADYFDPLTVGNYAENSWLPCNGSRPRG